MQPKRNPIPAVGCGCMYSVIVSTFRIGQEMLSVATAETDNLLHCSMHLITPVKNPNNFARPDKCMDSPTIAPTPPPNRIFVIVAVMWCLIQKYERQDDSGGTRAPANNPASALPLPQDVYSADNDVEDDAITPANADESIRVL